MIPIMLRYALSNVIELNVPILDIFRLHNDLQACPENT